MKVKPAELTELVELLARMLTSAPPAKNSQQEAGDAIHSLRRHFERARAAERAGVRVE